MVFHTSRSGLVTRVGSIQMRMQEAGDCMKSLKGMLSFEIATKKQLP